MENDRQLTVEMLAEAYRWIVETPTQRPVVYLPPEQAREAIRLGYGGQIIPTRRAPEEDQDNG